MMQLDTIVCMDALDYLRGLEDKFVDIVVTSPPYNIGAMGRRGGGMFKRSWKTRYGEGYANYTDDIPEADYQKWLYDVVNECMRVSKGLVWINHKMRYRRGIGIHPLRFLTQPVYSEIIWARAGSMELNSRRFATSHEYFFGFGKPHYWNNKANVQMTVWYMLPVNDTAHPCIYPERLIRKLIDASCPTDGIVLDCFMGSGTTALAARNLGRHYIGCDLSQEYVALAQSRLALPYTPLMI